MKKYIIGIDTGGTYTDAALIEADSSAVITTAKEPTTHYHLVTGTGHALAALLQSSAAATAARYFLSGVAKRLGTSVSFPDHCEVGNAIGAALLAKGASTIPGFSRH